MRFILSVAAVAGLLALPVVGHADPVTYTESAVGSGTLDGISFTDALVTITGTGDTSNAYLNTSNNFYINVLSFAQVSVAGITDTFSSPVEAFALDSVPGAGLTDPGANSDIIDTVNAAFADYDLTTSIGPVTGAAATTYDWEFGTAGGVLVFDNLGDSTFTATVDTAATPEPSGLVLLGTGVLGLMGFARRRFLRA